MYAKLLLAACFLSASALAQAHAKIEASQPAAGSALAAAPTEIRLTFNEALEPAFSKIELVDGKQAAVPMPKVALDPADAKIMFAPVPGLAPGPYQVRWTAMTHDGHKVKGQYAFTVK